MILLSLLSLLSTNSASVSSQAFMCLARHGCIHVSFLHSAVSFVAVACLVFPQCLCAMDSGVAIFSTYQNFISVWMLDLHNM